MELKKEWRVVKTTKTFIYLVSCVFWKHVANENFLPQKGALIRIPVSSMLNYILALMFDLK